SLCEPDTFDRTEVHTIRHDEVDGFPLAVVLRGHVLTEPLRGVGPHNALPVVGVVVCGHERFQRVRDGGSLFPNLTERIPSDDAHLAEIDRHSCPFYSNVKSDVAGQGIEPYPRAETHGGTYHRPLVFTDHKRHLCLPRHRDYSRPCRSALDLGAHSI